MKVYVVMEVWEDYDSYQSELVAAAPTLDAAKGIAERHSATNGIHAEIAKKRADALRENDLLEHVVEYRNQRVAALLEIAKREHHGNLSRLASLGWQVQDDIFRRGLGRYPNENERAKQAVDLADATLRAEERMSAEYARYSAECDRIRASVPIVPVPDELPFTWKEEGVAPDGAVSQEWRLGSTPYHVYEVEVTE